jgi:ribonuclease T
MDKKYISFDIEASGKTPGKYSMISLGACVVGDTAVQFYKEIKPISRNLIVPAMQVSVKGLRCLDNLKHQDEFNPKSDKFNPYKVLEVLYEKGEEPEKVMEEYTDWVKEVTKGFKPVEAAAPIKFDGMFTAWYFDNFYEEENPFGHSGEDINSMYRGVTKNKKAHIAQLGLRGDDLPHNALEDAIIQAKEFEMVLELLQK